MPEPLVCTLYEIEKKMSRSSRCKVKNLIHKAYMIISDVPTSLVDAIDIKRPVGMDLHYGIIGKMLPK